MIMRLVSFAVLVFVSFSYAQKLEITADKFSAKDSQRVVNFIGNAKIQQGSSSITAPKITLYFSEDNSTKEYRATGGVKFVIKKGKISYRGSCETVTYDPKSSIYKLTGSVKAKDTRNNREILADKIEIDSKSGAFTIKGSKKRAAKLIFDMK